MQPDSNPQPVDYDSFKEVNTENRIFRISLNLPHTQVHITNQLRECDVRVGLD